MKHNIHLSPILLGVALAAFAAQSQLAFASGPIISGDLVQLHYVCRLENGEVAASTMAESSLGVAEKKSSIFEPIQNDAPLSLQAGLDPKNQGVPAVVDFSDEIAAQIAHSLVGLQRNEAQTVKVSAARAHYREKAVISMVRVRQRPKELRMLPGEYSKRMGKDAEVGQVFTLDPDFPGKVVSSGENEVLIRFEAPANKKLVTPFGPAMVRESENQYLVDIDVRNEALVRTGPMVGRITAVDEKMFTVDYGHPLGGQDLVCDLSFLSADNEQKEGGEKNATAE